MKKSENNFALKDRPWLFSRLLKPQGLFRSPAVNPKNNTDSVQMEDKQNERDSRGLPIDQVGIRGVHLPIRIQDKSGAIQSTVGIAALSVDLTAELRGTHESVHRSDECVWKPDPG